MAKVSVKVLRDFKHGSNGYQRGKTIKIDDGLAQALANIGLVSKSGKQDEGLGSTADNPEKEEGEAEGV